ncbi:conserved exported hypothetical protein [Verrucomicrobia bacterium]|nr:conserved exported hypothetical protein [Verrucomicrobiota bacterium]
MKTYHPRPARGFTLVELLVVIAILAILAAMLVPVLAAMKRKAQISRARLQANDIANAIRHYESDYTRFPVSTAAANSVGAIAEDFTFGTANLTSYPQHRISYPDGSPALIQAPGAYQANNSEVMAVLLDLENYASGLTTVNQGHVKNPQHSRYLNATMVSDTLSPGIGLDGVFRDPWGNPYIITVDLNNDGKARDSIYRLEKVSQMTAGQPAGFFGLVNSTDAGGNGDHFECTSPVMVWSAGPDKMVDPNTAAKTGVNKDNILSWQQ